MFHFTAHKKCQSAAHILSRFRSATGILNKIPVILPLRDFFRFSRRQKRRHSAAGINVREVPKLKMSSPAPPLFCFRAMPVMHAFCRAAGRYLLIGRHFARRAGSLHPLRQPMHLPCGRIAVRSNSGNRFPVHSADREKILPNGIAAI